MLLIALEEHRVKLVNIFILAMDHTILHQVYFQTGVENHKSCLRAFGFIYLDDIFIKHKITEPQVDHFGLSQSGIQHQVNNTPVSQSKLSFQVKQLIDLLNF